jgi:hypothetical protein
MGELDMTQLTAFQILDSYYKEDMKKLDRIESDLKKLSDHILETVSRANLPYIEGKTDVRSMLIALRTRFKPTDYARKLEVGNKYNRLKSWTKRQPVEDWLQEWEFTINEGKKLQIPEVDGLRPLFDFTAAIRAIDSGYASAQDFAITQQVRDNTATTMEVYHLIEDFRNHYRRTITAKPSGSSGAFTATATLNSTDQNDNKPDAKPCLYGGKHRWNECHYITPSTRPSRWKGKPKIFEQINKKIKDMKSSPKYKTTKAEWFEHKFKYDGLTDTDKQSRDTKPSDEKTTKSLGSYATYASFHTNNTDTYKLYNE